MLNQHAKPDGEKEKISNLITKHKNASPREPKNHEKMVKGATGMDLSKDIQIIQLQRQ